MLSLLCAPSFTGAHRSPLDLASATTHTNMSQPHPPLPRAHAVTVPPYIVAELYAPAMLKAARSELGRGCVLRGGGGADGGGRSPG